MEKASEDGGKNDESETISGQDPEEARVRFAALRRQYKRACRVAGKFGRDDERSCARQWAPWATF